MFRPFAAASSRSGALRRRTAPFVHLQFDTRAGQWRGKAVDVSLSLILLFGCMFVVATCFSMVGQGGGALYTPIQVFFGIDFHEAATTSLFLIVMTSLSATLVFRKAGQIDWPLALVLESVTALGGLTGGLTSDRFSGTVLSQVFAGVVAFAAIFMVREFHGTQGEGGSPTPPVATWHRWHRRHEDLDYTVDMMVALPASFVAGLASGLVGVGGGILKVPLMVVLLGIPMPVAVGSSAFMVGLTASGGFAGHVANGHWDWKTSAILAGAAVVGAQVGARASIAVEPAKLKKAFGWFLMAVAALMVVRAW